MHKHANCLGFALDVDSWINLPRRKWDGLGTRKITSILQEHINQQAEYVRSPWRLIAYNPDTDYTLLTVVVPEERDFHSEIYARRTRLYFGKFGSLDPYSNYIPYHTDRPHILVRHSLEKVK